MATGPPVEVSDVSAARQQATGTMRDLQGIGDIVMDFTKEFRNIWEALTASHEEEEQFVEQVKALIVDVDQHKAAIGDSQVRSARTWCQSTGSRSRGCCRRGLCYLCVLQ
jgi:hypothetical protein